MQAVKAYIKWTKLNEVSESVIGSQAVVISGKVYIAGQMSTYCYQPSDDNWTTLPSLPDPVKSFGLGQFNGTLVAIGGQMEKNGNVYISNKVYMYEETLQKWKNKLPPMPTARFDPGVLSLQSALVVAGGEVADMECTNVVEILKGERPEELLWCTTNPLRVPCSRISIVSTGDTCYVIGGYIRQSELNQSLYASISELLHCAAPLNETNRIGRHAETQSAWKTIHNTFSYNPAAAVLAGNLITLGGWVEAAGGEIKKEVYVYSSSTDSWVYIGDLPVPLARTIVAAVSCSQILLIGGFSVGESMKSVYSGMFIVDL